LYQGTTLAVPQLLEIFPCMLAAVSISPQRAFRRSEHFAAASIGPSGPLGLAAGRVLCYHIWFARHYRSQVDVEFNATLAQCERCNKHLSACFPEWDALITPLRHPSPQKAAKDSRCVEMRNIVDTNKTHSVLFKHSLSTYFPLSGYRLRSDRVHPGSSTGKRAVYFGTLSCILRRSCERSQSLQDSAVACALDPFSRSRAFLGDGSSLRVCQMLDREQRLSFVRQ
jgi:hypothetical protein